MVLDTGVGGSVIPHAEEGVCVGRGGRIVYYRVAGKVILAV